MAQPLARLFSSKMIGRSSDRLTVRQRTNAPSSIDAIRRTIATDAHWRGRGDARVMPVNPG